MTRIKDAGATATAPAADDYLLLDGATNGSRKILASNASAMSLITETVTTSSASSVTFSSIPSTYRDLFLRIRGRGTTAATGRVPYSPAGIPLATCGRRVNHTMPTRPSADTATT